VINYIYENKTAINGSLLSMEPVEALLYGLNKYVQKKQYNVLLDLRGQEILKPL
jgi:hypothetical protein